MGKRLSILLLALIIGYGATMAIVLVKEVDNKINCSCCRTPNENRCRRNEGCEKPCRIEAYSETIAHCHIGFIKMEPNTLFLPLYLDSSLILFVHTGEATVGLIYNNKQMVERQLKIGDVFRIPAGSGFYILNTGEDQRLNIICSIDPSESLNDTLQVELWFGYETLSRAFNVLESELRGILNNQHEGPIVYLNNSQGPSIWNNYSLLEQQDRLKRLKRMAQGQQGEEEKEWSWWELFHKIIGIFDQDNDTNRDAPKPYNLYKKKLNFENNYGTAVRITESEYKPLKDTGIGLYLVNLTSGSMFAPHLNPLATNYGIILRGSGRVQIVYPNGTVATDAKVKEGDMFWVPRYYAFCQTASKTGPFEVFGFTTSSHRNHPLYLVGANSILQTLNSHELADAFGVSEAKIRDLVNAQREYVILPPKKKVYAF